MSPEICAAKMGHAIQARKGRTLALAMMWIKLLFGKDVSASLRKVIILACVEAPSKGDEHSYFTGERDHCDVRTAGSTGVKMTLSPMD